MKRIIYVLVFALTIGFATTQIQAQQILKFEDAIEVAAQNSPDIKQVRISMQRSQELLKAQEASLKSNFSFNVNPLQYSHGRSFNEYYNDWYTTDNLNSSGALTVSQPLIWTDGNISISNQLRWQNLGNWKIGLFRRIWIMLELEG